MDFSSVLIRHFRMSVQVGLAANIGFLGAHPYRQTLTGQRVQLAINFGLQVFCALFFAIGGAANDIWNGLDISLVYTAEAAATACIFMSVQVMDSDAPPTVRTANGTLALSADHLQRTARALTLAAWAAALLQVACVAPLLLVLYDGILVPIVTRVRDSDAGTVAEAVCETFIAIVVIPLQIVKRLINLDVDVDVGAADETSVVDGGVDGAVAADDVREEVGGGGGGEDVGQEVHQEPAAADAKADASVGLRVFEQKEGLVLAAAASAHGGSNTELLAEASTTMAAGGSAGATVRITDAVTALLAGNDSVDEGQIVGAAVEEAMETGGGEDASTRITDAAASVLYGAKDVDEGQILNVAHANQLDLAPASAIRKANDGAPRNRPTESDEPT